MNPTATQERLPRVGWRRLPDPRLPGPIPLSISAWSDGQATVISALEMAEAPDASGEAILTWHISVSEHGRRPRPRVLKRALAAFGMVGVEQDNHHPGHACHFFQPVDPRRRRGCECKVTEVVHTEPDGYQWTNPSDGPCRGCELAKLLPGQPCPIHPAGEVYPDLLGPLTPGQGDRFAALAATHGVLLPAEAQRILPMAQPPEQPQALGAFPVPAIQVTANAQGFALSCSCGSAWAARREAAETACPGCGARLLLDGVIA